LKLEMEEALPIL